jgi:hypothetical protein
MKVTQKKTCYKFTIDVDLVEVDKIVYEYQSQSLKFYLNE